MKNFRHFSLLLLFSLFILGLSLGDFIKPARSFSELENRYLASRPKLTWSSFLDGSFSIKFESWCNDQFLFRDQWIDLKSASESVLGKQENNGVIYGKDGYLFEKWLSCDQALLEKNTLALQKFSHRYGDRLTVALIPSSYSVLPDKVPTGLKNIDQAEKIRKLAEILPESSSLDLSEVLSHHTEEYIYYRTDHHWTTLGAFYAYEAICEALASSPLTLDSFPEHRVAGFYGTYFSKAKLRSAESDSITWYEIPFQSIEIDGQETDGLYQSSQWKKRDKYAAFLYGNHAVTIIDGPPKNNGKSILVIKDSFGNSIAPYFAGTYEKVTLVDLRHFLGKLSVLIKENEFDDILFLYNYKNFAEDGYMARLNY